MIQGKWSHPDVIDTVHVRDTIEASRRFEESKRRFTRLRSVYNNSYHKPRDI